MPTKTIKYQYKPFQGDFYTSLNRFPAFIAGWGTGKTMWALMKGDLLSRFYKNNLGLVVRNKFTDLRDCFDDKTEILTNSGWMFFNELDISRKVLSLGPDGYADYQPINHITKQEYNGKMKYFDGGSNFCVTPNHNLYISSPTSKDYKKAKSPFYFRKIEDMAQKFFYMKRDFKWSGEELKDIHLVPSRRQAMNYLFGGDDWLEFLGWFISEGHAYLHKTHKTWWIKIAQSRTVNPENYESIRLLLVRMGLSPTLVDDGITFGSRAIGEHLVLNCGKMAWGKYLPDYLKNATPRQIRIFLESYGKGDGYSFGNGFRYNTSSRQLADDVQEIIAKSGSHSKIHIRDNIGKESYIVDHWATTRHLDYLIIESSNKLKTYDTGVNTEEIEDVDYDGMIYCVTTEPHHTIYVRRNGSCYWSGNSTMKDFTKYTGKHIPQGTKEAHYANGSVILFRHAKELSGLQNVNIGWVYIEQGDEFPTDTQFQLLRGRLRRELEVDENYWALTLKGFGDVPVYPYLQSMHDKPLRQIMTICNANGHFWGWKMFIKSPKEGYSCVQADSFANKDNLPADFIEDLRRMEIDSPAKYSQYVMNCHDEVDLDACYYADSLNQLRKSGQIGTVHHDPAMRVNLAFDIGFDCTAVWFFQLLGQKVNVIDYYENTGKPLKHYVETFDRRKRDFGYNYGKLILPHDANKREMVAGTTLSKSLKDLAYDVISLPREQNLDFGINNVINVLPRCWFDENKCELGLEAIQHYRREYNEELKIYMEKPLHDWSSHPADSFRYLCRAVRKGLCGSVKSVTDEDIAKWSDKYRRIA